MQQSDDRFMDSIDRAILAVLQEHGRISNVELAERVNLTPGPCLRRVQRLESAGIIRGYQAVVDPGAVGRRFVALVAIDLESNDHETSARFEDAVVAFDEVTQAHRLFGTPDFMIRVEVADLDAYERFHSEHILRMPGVHRVRSSFSMKVLKGPGS